MHVTDDLGFCFSALEQQSLDAFLRESRRPEDALRQGDLIKTEASNKYGSVKVDGKPIDPMWTSTILGNLKDFIAVGDVVMKKAPESVGAAWFGISLALSAIQNNYDLHALFGTGLMDMTEMMVTIKHYDRLYHQRSLRGGKASEVSAQLFKNISETYAAMLDFSFSVHRHLSGSGWAKARHGFKDFFNANEKKFKDRTVKMAVLKLKVIEGSQGAFQEETFKHFDDVKDTLRLVQTNIQAMKDFRAIPSSSSVRSWRCRTSVAKP